MTHPLRAVITLKTSLFLECHINGSIEVLRTACDGLQHSLTCFGANLSVALIVAPAMCVTEPKDVSEILSTIFFMSGLVTLLQSTLGTRSVQRRMGVAKEGFNNNNNISFRS